MKYSFIIIFLILSTAIQAQTYEGTWHLIKKIESSDTTKFNKDIKEGRIEELTFYSEKSNVISKDTMIEDSTQFVSIGLQNTIEISFDEEMNEEYEEGSCPCFVYQSILDEYLFFQICESLRAFYRVELKNKELHLTTLRKFNWRKEIYERQKTKEVYIYTKAL